MVGRGQGKKLREEAWGLYFDSKLQRLGLKVGRMRVLKTLTQREIGRMLGVSQQTVSRYYNGIQREDAWSAWEDEDRTSDIASLRKRARRIVRL